MRAAAALILAWALAPALGADALDAAGKAELHMSRGDYDLAEKEAAKAPANPRAKEILEQARDAKAGVGATGRSPSRIRTPTPPSTAAVAAGHGPAASPTLTTPIPTLVPTAQPTATSTLVPTAVPTAMPTAIPTAVPTAIPTPAPTLAPTQDDAKLKAEAELRAAAEERERKQHEQMLEEKGKLEDERAKLDAERKALAEEREKVRREREEASRDQGADKPAESGAPLKSGGLALHFGLYRPDVLSSLDRSANNNPPGTGPFFPALKQPGHMETHGHLGAQLRWNDFFLGAAATMAEGGYWKDTRNQPPAAPWNPGQLELRIFQFALGWEWNFWRAHSTPGFGMYLPLAAEYNLGYADTGGSPYVGQVPGAYAGLGLRFTPWRYFALELEGLFHVPFGYGEFQDEYGKQFTYPEGVLAMDSLGPNLRLKTAFLLW